MRIEKLNLKKTRNMRDLGGIPAEGGKAIRYGKIIRSGRLYKLPPATVDTLYAMKVDTVIDFRTAQEIEEHKSTHLKSAAYYNLALVATATEEIQTGKSMANIFYKQSKRIKRDIPEYEDYMHLMYEILAFHPASIEKLKTVFDLLLKEENCLLYHCNSGTDRTGIVSMLIESVLGVGKELIIEDYMASKYFLRRRRNTQKFLLKCVPAPLKLKRLLYAQMIPQQQYITRLMEEMEKRYGSVTGYAKQVLGITEEQIQTLKDKYLE